MDLNAALKWLNDAVINNIGQDLREPELVILRGTWRGLTYQQMATSSDYSTNYLMRDVAPKLWKQLSNVFGRSVGKTNFRVALEAYAAANNRRENQFNLTGASNAADLLPGSAPISTILLKEEPETYWRPLARSPAAASDDALREDTEAGDATVYSGVSVSAAAAAVMVGYTHELAQLTHWISETRASSAAKLARQRRPTGRLIGVWGLHGVGKTLLIEKLIVQVGESFGGIARRQLTSQPLIDELSASILSGLGVVPQATRAMAQLLALMTQKPLLIVLEGTEAILRAGVLAGDYQAAYQGYREFFQSVMGSRSCVVVTGSEGPSDLVRQIGNGCSEDGRSLTLSRLEEPAAIELLQTLWQAESPTIAPPPELSSSADEPESNRDQWLAQWPELVARCQGHPLALKAALRVIQEIFNGQVDDFLAQSSVLFTDILRLLAPSFNRLSRAEVQVIYWLASQEAPLSLRKLQQTLPLLLSSAELVSVLYSLKQRSLLEISTQAQSPTFYLPKLVKAYAIHQFINRLSAEESSTAPLAYQTSAQVIDLNPSVANDVRLSQWFQGQFEADWQSLAQLFESSARPAMRLSGVYYLQDETFIKRFKPISLSAKTAAKGVLLVAIHQEAENLYKVCVQAQPAQDASVLPERLALSLLDAQQNVLATVVAQQDDSFIQLPYFRGAIAESFAIELALGGDRHIEAFVI